VIRGYGIFNSRQAADDYVKSLTIPQEHKSIRQLNPRTREIDFDTSKFSTKPVSNPKLMMSSPDSNPTLMSTGVMPDPGFLLGNLEKVGPTKWRSSTRGERFSVDTVLITAVLCKLDKSDASSAKLGEAAEAKFQSIISEGTSGPNYSVDLDMVLEHLKKWDRLYGIKVLKASRDSMEIEFTKLPDDLGDLCTEMWLFCPDLLEMDLETERSYVHSSAQMRQFARRLRATRRVSFWWD
jgi:hypothetical protein